MGRDKTETSKASSQSQGSSMFLSMWEYLMTTQMGGKKKQKKKHRTQTHKSFTPVKPCLIFKPVSTLTINPLNKNRLKGGNILLDCQVFSDVYQ